MARRLWLVLVLVQPTTANVGGLNPAALDLVMSVRDLSAVLLVGDAPSAGECGFSSSQRWLTLFSTAQRVQDAQLKSFNPPHGQYELVIDVSSHALATLESAWAWVRPGGHYVVASARSGMPAAPGYVLGNVCAAPRLHWHPLLNATTISTDAKEILDKNVWAWMVDGLEPDGTLMASLVVRHQGAAPLSPPVDKKKCSDDGRLATVSSSTQLAHLFAKHGTDKCVHRYDYSYTLLFEPHYTRSSRRVLEVGIGTGHCNSLRAWLDFFPSAIVHGYDKRPYTLDADLLTNKRLVIKTNIMTGQKTSGGQVQVDEKWVAKNVPECDVIIDDGCHKHACQIETLNIFWPRLRPGGLYIVEDMWLQPSRENGRRISGFSAHRPERHPLLNHALIGNNATRRLLQTNTWAWLVSGRDPKGTKFVPKNDWDAGIRGYSAVLAIRKGGA